MRRFLICILMAWAVAPLSSFAQYTAAVLEINSKDGVYAVGDSIKVWANLTPECESVQEFTVQEDMLHDILKQEMRLGPGRHLVYAGVCSKPVNYVFTFGKPGADRDYKKASIVGAIVAPETMRPGYKAPKDLRKFWDNQLKKMRKMPIESRLTPVPQEYNPDIVCFDLEIPMPEGAPVRGYVAYPKNADLKTLPILIMAHAAGVKGGWCQCKVETTVKNASRGKGTIALDINAHGMLNGQPQQYYDSLEANELKGYSSWDFTGHKDFYFRLMYLRMVRALDYAVSLPQWDGERVFVYGESQGGAQAAALAGIDSRVTAVNLRVPAFIDVAGLYQNRKGSWPGKYSADPKKYAKVVPYYDGALLLSMSKAKMFVEAGLVDYTCPPSCVAAGFNNAASTDKTIVFFPYRPHHEDRMPKDMRKRWREEVKAPREKFREDYLQ